jgi:hypothetical protein
MNGYLDFEMLEDIPCPDHLQKDYEDLDTAGQVEWFNFTFQAVLQDATMVVSGFLGRDLTRVEISLIQRRIVDFFGSLKIGPEGSFDDQER